MSGERPFDDDRWPDEEGFAWCFKCGKKIDPLDSKRCTFTMNVRACEPIPAHQDCLEGYGGDSHKTLQIQVAYMTALNEMSVQQIRRLRRQANVVAPPVAVNHAVV
jgi:hypothetical protein